MDGLSYTYDANGNLLDDCANTYGYDYANRIVYYNGTTSYSHNGLGECIGSVSKTVTLRHLLLCLNDALHSLIGFYADWQNKQRLFVYQNVPALTLTNSKLAP